MPKTTQQYYDVLIIGSGAAGLSMALRLSSNLKIAVIAKRALEESNTLYAQGGISAVLGEQDTIDSHINDTINAGAGICNTDTVKTVVERGPQNIQWLLDNGVKFTRTDNTHFHLTKEGGHSHRRVVHAADATGQAIESTLVSQTLKKDNIDVYENHIAIDLITETSNDKKRCIGAYILDNSSDKVITFSARFVILATGGAAKVYLYTSNPDVSTGDGIAMAWRSGCRVANMEFIQFHPTCLYHPEAKSFLLTEALRGEGARLLLPNGEPFMHQYDPRGELAPRDIVARAIDHEMKRLGADCLYLDISHQSESFINEHFPTIQQRLEEYGYDLNKGPVPIVPAAHYTCGGIVSDHNAQTDILSLYAIGECAYSGLHGANRMASNSLLECLVYGELAAEHILAQSDMIDVPQNIAEWDDSRVSDSDEEVVVSHNWDELRRFMWDYVGIVRSNKRLQRAKRRSDLLRMEIREYYSNFRINNDLLELRNLVDVADMIIQSAQQRKESRGLHYTIDFPKTDNQHQQKPTILMPDQYYPNQ